MEDRNLFQTPGQVSGERKRENVNGTEQCEVGTRFPLLDKPDSGTQ